MCTWASFSRCDVEFKVAPRACIGSSRGKKNFFSPSRGEVNGIGVVGAARDGRAFDVCRFKPVYPRVRVQCCTGLVNSNPYLYPGKPVTHYHGFTHTRVMPYRHLMYLVRPSTCLCCCLVSHPHARTNVRVGKDIGCHYERRRKIAVHERYPDRAYPLQEGQC
jgi:hypothetical protein